MRKLLLGFALLLSVKSVSQIDISLDMTLVGLYPNLKVTYPVKDRLILGADFGWNVMSPYLHDRFHFVTGIKVDEQLQVEVELGAISGHDPWDLTKRYMFDGAIGAKYFTNSFFFFTLQVTFPTFAEVGLGVRLRPYKKLTTWDRITM